MILEKADPIEVTLEQTHGRQHVIGRLRVSVSSSQSPHLAKPVPIDIGAILRMPLESRTREQQHILAVYYLTQRKSKELAALPPPGTIYAVASQFPNKGNFKAATKPRAIHVLDRGNVLTPLERHSQGRFHAFQISRHGSKRRRAKAFGELPWLIGLSILTTCSLGAPS